MNMNLGTFPSMSLVFPFLLSAILLKPTITKPGCHHSSKELGGSSSGMGLYKLLLVDGGGRDLFCSGVACDAVKSTSAMLL